MYGFLAAPTSAILSHQGPETSAAPQAEQSFRIPIPRSSRKSKRDDVESLSKRNLLELFGTGNHGLGAPWGPIKKKNQREM